MRTDFIKFLKFQGRIFCYLFFLLIFLSFGQSSFAVKKDIAKEQNENSEIKKEGQSFKQETEPVFSNSELSREEETKDKALKEKEEEHSPYFFRPLLIQGKKRLIQKTKDMKVDSGNIVESKLFFIDIDFKKRLFEYEVDE